MINAWIWKPNTKTFQPIKPADLPAHPVNQLAADDVVWIDLDQPSEEEERQVLADYLPIHPLSLEDVSRQRREPDAWPHLPKVEEFPDYLLVIVNPLTKPFMDAMEHTAPGKATDVPMLTQLSAVITKQVLVTHHAQPLASIDYLTDQIKRHAPQCSRGPDYLFHLVLDHAVDQFVPVLDSIEDRLDAVEEEVIRRPRPALFGMLLKMKRKITLLRKSLVYEREVLVRLARGEFDLVDERETVYYRNVYDHLVRFTELIESSREMVADLMQTHLAATGNRLNEIMKVLAMISTVGSVSTVIAGIYGMNFKNMPELDWQYGYPFALGLMVISSAIALGIFRWKKWL